MGPTSSGTSTATGERAAQREQVRSLARLLDSQFRLPGTQRRFGIDGLLGLVPGIGDAAGLALSTIVIAQAVRLGARGSTAGRMVLNVAVDAVVGSVPVLGWFFDFAFKANTRNLALLERHTVDPDATSVESRQAIRRTIVLVVVAVVAVVFALFALLAWLLTLVF